MPVKSIGINYLLLVFNYLVFNCLFPNMSEQETDWKYAGLRLTLPYDLFYAVKSMDAPSHFFLLLCSTF